MRALSGGTGGASHLWEAVPTSLLCRRILGHDSIDTRNYAGHRDAQDVLTCLTSLCWRDPVASLCWPGAGALMKTILSSGRWPEDCGSGWSENSPGPRLHGQPTAWYPAEAA